jgi:GNAT superfamily N-acetyltransferase
MIKIISFEEILEIWSNYLWKERTSKIESHSAMLYLGNGYDIKNFDYTPSYFAYYVNDRIAGVNSGHMCSDNSYRSRGLYVHPEYRNQGIGRKLLIATWKQGITENANFVWSYPKLSSWNTYQSAGFTLTSEWGDSELGKNAYCFFDCSSINS